MPKGKLYEADLGQGVVYPKEDQEQWPREKQKRKQKNDPPQNQAAIDLLDGKPFWLWDRAHSLESYIVQNETVSPVCCFNHIVGLPRKNGIPMPLFDYEKKVIDILRNWNDDAGRDARPSRSKQKHLWIKKATGLGITELVIRYMAWLCYRDSSFAGAQMCIVTGPNIDLAKGLIARIKQICLAVDPDVSQFSNTTVVLNGCKVEAYPSHHLDAMRALERPVFILLDEADFFPPGEQKNARDVSERYIAKSDPYIVMVSTPNLPGGLFEQIEKEPEETCLYHRLYLPYTVGVGKIYTEHEIEKAKQSPSFEREYNLKYGYGLGNIFPYQLVDQCIGQYDLGLRAGTAKVLAVDPAYGSSKFAIAGFELVSGIVYVKDAREYERPSPSAMLDAILKMTDASSSSRYDKVLVDSAHPGLVTDLQQRGVTVEAVNFQKELSDMTMKAAQAVKEQKVRIHPAFTEMTYQLKAVQFNEKGHPDKKQMTFDLGDCFLMGVSRLLQANNYSIYVINRR